MPAIMRMCNFCGTTSARPLCGRCMMVCYERGGYLEALRWTREARLHCP
jgi:hypothetical protein